MNLPMDLGTIPEIAEILIIIKFQQILIQVKGTVMTVTIVQTNHNKIDLTLLDKDN
jgi:hypothetical protein